MDQVAKIAFRKGTQMATKKFLDKEFNENKGKAPGGRWDPYFEYRPDRKGRMKKVKKHIPDYIPEHDAKVLANVRKWAYRLDMKLNILGMRFGWSSVIGAIPELGDIVDILFAVMVYQKCKKIEGGLDTKTKAKMKAWIVTDGLVGLIPIIGDVIDASIKCNARNCRLLEEFLDTKYKPEHLLEAELKRREKDPNYKAPAPATIYEGSDEEHDYHHPREIEYGTTNGHHDQIPSQRAQHQTSHNQPVHSDSTRRRR